MQVPFRLLDVFAEAPFEGNQLCVVPDAPGGLDGETMQTLAREIGFSETTFVTAIRDGGYDVRIFTAGAELAFAGHPTWARRSRWSEAGLVTSPVVQTSTAGDVPVEVDLANQATMRQLPPVFGPRSPTGRPSRTRPACARTTSSMGSRSCPRQRAWPTSWCR